MYQIKVGSALSAEKMLNCYAWARRNTCRKKGYLSGHGTHNGTSVTVYQVYILPGGFSESVSVNGDVYQHTVVKAGTVIVVLQGQHRETAIAEKEILQEKSSPFPKAILLYNKAYGLDLKE
nr:hypothetical protein [uncultured Mucilaginibacter sp.]